jgi:hypothetical protein
MSINRNNSHSAMTLVEVMVSIAVGSIVMIAIIGMMMYTSKSFAALANYVDLDSSSRNAVDRITTDIRQANYLRNNGYVIDPPSITFSMWSDDMHTNDNLTYRYDPSEKKLIRELEQQGGPRVETVLLTGCEPLPGIPIFQVFQRNTISNSFNQYEATAGSYERTAKVIQVSWVCKRRILSQYNTESVQTAKIVLRNQQQN